MSRNNIKLLLPNVCKICVMVNDFEPTVCVKIEKVKKLPQK